MIIAKIKLKGHFKINALITIRKFNMKKMLLGMAVISLIHADQSNLDCDQLKEKWKTQFKDAQTVWFEINKRFLWKKLTSSNARLDFSVTAIDKQIEELAEKLFFLENDFCSRIYVMSLINKLKSLKQDITDYEKSTKNEIALSDIPNIFNGSKDQSFLDDCKLLNNTRFFELHRYTLLISRQLKDYELTGENFPVQALSNIESKISELLCLKSNADDKRDLCSYIYIDGLLSELLSLKAKMHQMHKN